MRARNLRLPKTISPTNAEGLQCVALVVFEMLVAEPAGRGEGLGRVEVKGGVEDGVLVHFDFGL